MLTKIENIPQELKALQQWVCWVGADKIPKNPYTGRNAKSNDSSTWSSFAKACDACNEYHFDGLGFMFGNGYFGVDLDHCADKVDFCDEFVETLKSYAEYSKSGDGIHIICKGELPSGARRRGNVEMYSEGRYFICTGNLYGKYRDIAECTESIKILHSKYLPSVVPKAMSSFEMINLDDQEVINIARNSKSGRLFNMLYSGDWQGVYASQSEADLAFCNQLAFWTQKNQDQMDRIFRSSGLMREKWDSKRNGKTYGSITINKACIACADVYKPKMHNEDASLALAFFRSGSGSENGKQQKQYDMTDTGNARRLSDRFGHIIHYSYNRKKWYYWDGKVWRLDDSGEIKKLADIICEDIKREAFMEPDEKTQMELLKWANRTAGSRGKEAMIHECQHLDGIPVGMEEFDAYPDYLNCHNGIVNLKNGELIPHDSNFMMSKICNCEYDASGKKPEKWLAFLNDVTGGNKALQNYIQKSIGYSLTGSIEEQCAYFLYGVGNNGKTTFMEVISEMLGGYSSNVQPETFMVKRFSSEGAGADIARLKSSRFIMAEEPTEGVRLNEGLLKQLTGGGRVTCRFLYGDEFEYTPEFKIWIATNHKPVIRGTDVGIWRRIKLIPFEVTIPKEKVDKNLKYKLRAEFPQILRWAVEGCMAWKKEGLGDPDAVQQATKEYKREMDTLAGFVEECVEINYLIDEKVSGTDLFKAYVQWARDNNEYEMTSKKFHSEISKKLPEKGRNNKGIFYRHIRIIQQRKQYSFSSFYKGGNGA